MQSMSVNGRLNNLERIVDSDWHEADRGAVRAAILEVLANRDTVKSLRKAAVAEDCNLSLESQIMKCQTDVY
jgi:hypothetical protein